MACDAARTAVYRALCKERAALTAEAVWGRVRWWTHETIDEALGELVVGKAVVRDGKHFKAVGNG